MKLYSMKRVMTAEMAPGFLEFQVRREARRSDGRRAAETRRRNAAQWAAETPVLLECPTHSLKDLQRMAVNRRNKFLESLDWRYRPSGLLPEPRCLDQETLDRLCANLLRHECSDYDEALADTFGRTGRDLAIRIIRARIHREIALRWPALARECDLKAAQAGVRSNPG